MSLWTVWIDDDISIHFSGERWFDKLTPQGNTMVVYAGVSVVDFANSVPNFSQILCISVCVVTLLCVSEETLCQKGNILAQLWFLAKDGVLLAYWQERPTNEQQIKVVFVKSGEASPGMPMSSFRLQWFRIRVNSSLFIDYKIVSRGFTSMHSSPKETASPVLKRKTYFVSG